MTPEHPRLDQLLDLLADEVAERLRSRSGRQGGQSEPPPSDDAAPETGTEHVRSPVAVPVHNAETPPEAATSPRPLAVGDADEPLVLQAGSRPDGETTAEEASDTGDDGGLAATPEALPMVAGRSHAATLMARLAIGLFVVVVLINIPFNRHGTALARAIPGSAALVIRDGLLVKEEDKPEIYVYRDDEFHWISSLDAFGHYGYRWQDVHIVEPGYLARFETGAPVHVLLKCDASPHIYRLENGVKRWIVDIPTLEAEGHVWEDVQIVPCRYLRNLPDGDSIPPGNGLPPE